MDFERVFTKVVEKVLCPRWIVGPTGTENDGELGFRIGGINFWYYKRPEPIVTLGEIPWRMIEKREFGEVILSRKAGAGEKKWERHD